MSEWRVDKTGGKKKRRLFLRAQRQQMRRRKGGREGGREGGRKYLGIERGLEGEELPVLVSAHDHLSH